MILLHFIAWGTDVEGEAGWTPAGSSNGLTVFLLDCKGAAACGCMGSSSLLPVTVWAGVGSCRAEHGCSCPLGLVVVLCRCNLQVP